MKRNIKKLKLKNNNPKHLCLEDRCMGDIYRHYKRLQKQKRPNVHFDSVLCVLSYRPDVGATGASLCTGYVYAVLFPRELVKLENHQSGRAVLLSSGGSHKLHAAF